MDRRDVLALIGTVGSVTVAGCSSEVSGDESDGGDGEIDGNDGDSSGSPERAVEGYYRAVARGDEETANGFVVNEESTAHVEEEEVDGNDDADGLSFSRLEEISLRTWLEETGGLDEEAIGDDLDPDEVVQFMRRWFENHLEEEGYDEYAFVYAEIQIDGRGEYEETGEIYALLFERDGEWLIDQLEENYHRSEDV